MKRIFLLRFAASRTLHGPWDMLDPLCVGGMLDDEEFSLALGLPSPASAVAWRSTLFGWFIGIMPRSDSSATFALGVRRLAFPSRPVFS